MCLAAVTPALIKSWSPRAQRLQQSAGCAVFFIIIIIVPSFDVRSVQLIKKENKNKVSKVIVCFLILYITYIVVELNTHCAAVMKAAYRITHGSKEYRENC